MTLGGSAGHGLWVAMLAAMMTTAQTPRAAMADDAVFVPAMSELDRLERQMDDIRLAPPRFGVAFSSVLVPLGIAALVLENPANNLRTGEGKEERVGLLAFGAAAVAVGIAGIVASATRLSHQKRKRRELTPRVAALREQQNRDLAPLVEPLEGEADRIRLDPLRTGLAISSLSVVLGIIAVALPSNEDWDDSGAGLYSAGSLLLAGGIAGLVLSGIKLRRRKQRRAELRREIQRLRLGPQAQ